MKKILIASTALVAAGLMTTGTAAASEKIKLNLGGFSKWWVVGAWQDSDYEAVVDGASTNADVKGDNEIWFHPQQRLDRWRARGTGSRRNQQQLGQRHPG